MKKFVCSSCMDTERGKVIAISDYLEKNPNSNLNVVSRELEINSRETDVLLKKDLISHKEVENNYDKEFEIIKKIFKFKS